MKKLSIVTVVFNDSKGVKKTLESIHCLSKVFVFDVELIVVNGLSTDNTDEVISNEVEVLRRSGIDCKYINEKDDGIYDAMNKGVLNTALSSSYCIFMNAGDFFTDEASIILSNFFDSDQDEDIVVFPIRSVGRNGQKLRIREFRDAELLRKMPAVPHQSTLIRTSVMKEKLYDVNYRILADYDFFCKCYNDKFVSMKYIESSPIAVFVQGGASNSYGRQLEFLCEIVSVQKKNFNRVSFSYLAVPLLKWTLFRYSFIRRFDGFFRRFI